MKKVVIVSSNATTIYKVDDAEYIGVEKGIILLSENKVPMKYAIGDFDSISEEWKQRVEQLAQTIVLPTHKNETDSEYALRLACAEYDEVYICGVSGKRQDHFIAVYNLLAYHKELCFTIVDEYNVIRRLDEGSYTLKKHSEYISLFALEDTVLSIRGVAYPLENRALSQQDVYTISNEILNQEANLDIIKGSVMLVESNDKAMY